MFQLFCQSTTKTNIILHEPQVKYNTCNRCIHTCRPYIRYCMTGLHNSIHLNDEYDVISRSLQSFSLRIQYSVMVDSQLNMSAMLVNTISGSHLLQLCQFRAITHSSSMGVYTKDND